jgi:hypothetical protein
LTNNVCFNSPVKNRDGPIAGIAHTGGGSRQLGPDDNDPVSATQIPLPNHIIFLLSPPHHQHNNTALLSLITHDFLNASHFAHLSIFAAELKFEFSINLLSGFTTL